MWNLPVLTLQCAIDADISEQLLASTNFILFPATNLVPGEQSASRALFTMHVSRAGKKRLNIAEWIQGMLSALTTATE